MNSRFLSRLAQWTIILLLPVFIILSTLYIFMSEAFVRYEYTKPDFPPSIRFTADARYYNSVESLKFVIGQRTLEQFVALGVYNDREISHMRDVQRVTLGALTTHAIAGIFIVVALVYLLYARRTRLHAYNALLTGSILTLVLLAFIGVFSTVAFDQFFALFHSFFFTGDSWLFPVTDSLIQFYPIQFWEDVSYGIALFSLAGTVLVGGTAWIFKR